MSEYPGLQIHVYEVINEFFGELITVSGLLTGQDIVKQLKDKIWEKHCIFPGMYSEAERICSWMIIRWQTWRGLYKCP